MYICTLSKMMKDRTDYVTLYRIAKAYYLENQSQFRIAKEENISRPHVSRLLSKARQLGIVTIKVEMPNQMHVDKLQDDIQNLLGLKKVLLADVSNEDLRSPQKIARSIATLAAENLMELLGDANQVGVGWGYTIYQTSLMLPKAKLGQSVTFVPLVGMSDESNPYLQNNVIIDRFAEKFNASSYYTSLPAYYERHSTKGKTERDRYSRLRQRWERLDAAVVGLGPRFKNGDFLIREASEEYKQLIAGSEVVGDILASFFFEDGTLLDSHEYYEQVSLPLPRLKEIRNVICLAGGTEKVPGVIAAARNGYIKTLITDINTAQLIIRKIQDSESEMA